MIVSLETPEALDQPSGIARQSDQHASGGEEAHRSSNPSKVLLVIQQSKVRMRHSGDQQHGQSSGDGRLVAAIQLRQTGHDERERHILDEVALRAAGGGEEVRLIGEGIGGLGGGLGGGLADGVLEAEALLDHSALEVEVVGAEWEGKGRGDGELEADCEEVSRRGGVYQTGEEVSECCNEDETCERYWGGGRDEVIGRGSWESAVALCLPADILEN